MRILGRRAVSPVVSVILIIAITVAAAGLTYGIINAFFANNAPDFVLTGKAFYDHNNDGKIDAINLDVLNLGHDASANYTSLEYWYVYATDNVVPSKLSRSIIIYTNSSNAQLNVGDSVDIGLSDIPGMFKLSTIEITSLTKVNPITVTVKNGNDTVQDAVVSFKTYKDYPVSFPPTRTDENGQINAYLLPNYYKAISGDKESDIFFSLIQKTVTISGQSLPMETVYVKALDSSGSVLSGITIYTTDTALNDLGDSAITNSSGIAEFTLVQGEYLFRMNYVSQNFYSSQISIPGSSNRVFTISVQGGDLIAKAYFGDTPIGSNRLIRLYTSLNSSMNRYDYTNSSSYFEFSGVPSGLYRLRLDYMNNYFWSPIISTSDTSHTLNFGGGRFVANMTAGGELIPRNVLVRLFIGSRYTYSYRRVNSSGMVDFGVLPKGNYKLRLDWLSMYTFSNNIRHTDSTLKQVDYDGGKLIAKITVGGSNLPRNTLIRLFTDTGRYTYIYSRINSTGYVNFGTIIAGNFKFRIDYLQKYTYTTNFTHDGTPQFIDLEGGKLTAKITVGGSNLPRNTLIRLFTDTNKYTYIYSRVNSTGYVNFAAILAGNYKFRIDYLQKYTYTDTFEHINSSVKFINMSGGDIIAKVTVGGENLPRNTLIRLFTDSYRYTYYYARVNSTGYVKFSAILAGNYTLRVDYLQKYTYTDLFEHLNSSVKYINIAGGSLIAKITVGGANLPQNTLIRLFTDTNRYTYYYSRVNSTGFVKFSAIISGNYTLRLDYLQSYTYTDVFEHINGSVVHYIDMPGGDLEVLLTIDGVPIRSNVLVRLFKTNNQYTYYYARVNSTGYVKFSAILAGDYKFRIDWLSKYTYTNNFTHDGTPFTMELGGGQLVAKISIDGQPLPNNVLTRLFTSDGKYTYLYAYTNASGYVNYGGILSGNYTLRVDWLGSYYWTEYFVINNSSAKSLSINGYATMTIRVYDAKTSSYISSGTVYLYHITSSGSRNYYKYATANSSGYVSFTVVPSGDYQIRYDSRYSSTFSASNSLEVTIPYTTLFASEQMTAYAINKEEKQ